VRSRLVLLRSRVRCCWRRQGVHLVGLLVMVPQSRQGRPQVVMLFRVFRLRG
jgi:hypothetical protein